MTASHWSFMATEKKDSRIDRLVKELEDDYRSDRQRLIRHLDEQRIQLTSGAEVNTFLADSYSRTATALQKVSSALFTKALSIEFADQSTQAAESDSVYDSIGDTPSGESLDDDEIRADN